MAERDQREQMDQTTANEHMQSDQSISSEITGAAEGDHRPSGGGREGIYDKRCAV